MHEGPAPGSLEPGAVLAGYRIIGVLGRGGMGVVYRAEDMRLGRHVALKVLSPDVAADPVFRERFTRESRMLASVEHPNIVSVFHADQADGLSFLAMRLVDGVDLGALLRTRGRLKTAVVDNVVRQIAEALDVAHAHELVHRDVKPGNILIAARNVPLEDAQVYLTDFGLTRRTDAPTELTVTGQFLGTVDYVAPEQIQGADLDGRADLYALACVAFECLTGQPPFYGAQDAGALMAHLVSKPPSLTEHRPDLPAAVGQVLVRGMAKSRDQRQSTCPEFARELSQAFAGSAPAVPNGSGAPGPGPLAGQAPVDREGGQTVVVPSPLPPSLVAPPPSSRLAAPPRAAPSRGRPTPIRDEPWFEWSPRVALPRRARRRSSSGTLVNVLIGIVGVMVLAVVALVLFNVFGSSILPRSNTSPSGAAASPAGGGSGEVTLRGHVPAAIRPGCGPEEPEPPAVAALHCRAEDGAVELRYSLFADRNAMSAAYEEDRREWGVAPDLGQQGHRCEDPASWPNEGRWTFRNVPTGRLMCSTVNGLPQMEWSDDRSNVLTHAIDHAQDGLRLYRFWLDGRFPSPGTSESPLASASPGASSPEAVTSPVVTPSAVERLRSHIPRSIRAACEADVVVQPVVASQRCSAEDGLVELTYSLYPDRSSMTEAYRQERDSLGIARNSGEQGSRCADGTSWPNEGQYTYRREEVGRVLCAVVNGTPLMAWTDTRFNILSRAEGHGAEADELYDFWVGWAGPF